MRCVFPHRVANPVTWRPLSAPFWRQHTPTVRASSTSRCERLQARAFSPKATALKPDLEPRPLASRACTMCSAAYTVLARDPCSTGHSSNGMVCMQVLQQHARRGHRQHLPKLNKGRGARRWYSRAAAGSLWQPQDICCEEANAGGCCDCPPLIPSRSQPMPSAGHAVFFS